MQICLQPLAKIIDEMNKQTADIQCMVCKITNIYSVRN